MIALFIDTNILLHFKTFDEVDWHKIAGDSFELQIAPIVLDELDKHKNNQNSKIAQRARMIANKFERMIDGEDGKVPTFFIINRPLVSYFENNQLDPKQQDDCLLATILQFQENNPTVAIKLISDDLGVKLKGRTLGIEVVKLNEDLRLLVLDKSQKEIERLQKQVTVLTERIPKLTFGFEDRAVHEKKEIHSNVKTLKDYTTDEMANIKREHPPMPVINGDTIVTNMMEMLNSTGGIFGLSNERRETYNKKLDDFYSRYEQYLSKKYDIAIKRLKSFSLTFYLFNDGSTPAMDTDIWLHLPDGFTVSKYYPAESEKPKPPYRPKSNFDYEPMNTNFPDLINRISPVNQTPRINPNKPTIKKTNSYEVTYHIASLKHGQQRAFDPIIVQYDRFEDMNNFTIDYRMNISNVPEAIEGKLHVIITQKR